jgi:hypothetical protein
LTKARGPAAGGSAEQQAARTNFDKEQVEAEEAQKAREEAESRLAEAREATRKLAETEARYAEEQVVADAAAEELAIEEQADAEELAEKEALQHAEQSNGKTVKWIEGKDPSGRSYFYNPNTKESHWDAPPPDTEVSEPSIAAPVQASGQEDRMRLPPRLSQRPYSIIADFEAQPFELKATLASSGFFVLVAIVYCIMRMWTTAKYRKVLHSFYAKHCPEKISDIEMILWTYAGRETQMIQDLEKKYI